jgi:nitroreductase
MPSTGSEPKMHLYSTFVLFVNGVVCFGRRWTTTGGLPSPEIDLISTIVLILIWPNGRSSIEKVWQYMKPDDAIRDAALVRLGVLPKSAAEMAKLLVKRYTCRAYLPDRVPSSIIRQILEIAQYTASWCNTQPWELVVTSGSGTHKLAAALYQAAQAGHMEPDITFPAQYDEVQDQRRKRCGAQLYESVGIPRGDEAGARSQMLENFRFFGAPHVAVITTPSNLGAYGALDCGGYIANFILAARAMGVDTTPQAAVAQQAALLRKHLNLPKGRLVLCSIAFGYADAQHPVNSFRTERAPPEAHVRFVK